MADVPGGDALCRRPADTNASNSSPLRATAGTLASPAISASLRILLADPIPEIASGKLRQCLRPRTARSERWPSLAEGVNDVARQKPQHPRIEMIQVHDVQIRQNTLSVKQHHGQLGRFAGPKCRRVALHQVPHRGKYWLEIGVRNPNTPAIRILPVVNRLCRVHKNSHHRPGTAMQQVAIFLQRSGQGQ